MHVFVTTVKGLHYSVGVQGNRKSTSSSCVYGAFANIHFPAPVASLYHCLSGAFRPKCRATLAPSFRSFSLGRPRSTSPPCSRRLMRLLTRLESAAVSPRELFRFYLVWRSCCPSTLLTCHNGTFKVLAIVHTSLYSDLRPHTFTLVSGEHSVPWHDSSVTVRS